MKHKIKYTVFYLALRNVGSFEFQMSTTTKENEIFSESCFRIRRFIVFKCRVITIELQLNSNNICSPVIRVN